jgi:DNA repair protein RadC
MKTKYTSLKKITCVSEPNNSFDQVKVTNSKIAADFARQFYSDDIELYESMFIIMMSNSHQTIAWAKISQGGVSETMCDPKIVAKYAIDTLCSAVILVHNHPSGNLTPSQEDRDITAMVKSGLAMFDIKLFDHIILTSAHHYSFADEGVL